MKVSGTVSAVLAHKKASTVWSIGPNAMVRDAIQLMAEKNVGALTVVDNGTLVGIVSERDYTRKVILKGRSSKETPVSDIMTAQLLTNGHSERQCYRVHADNDRKARAPPSCSGRNQSGRDSLDWRRGKLVYLGADGDY